MRNTFAVRPAAGSQIRLDAEFDDGAAAAVAYFIAHILAVGLAALAVPAHLHEFVRVLAIANRHADTVGSANAVFRRHGAVRVWRAGVALGPDELVFDAAGMVKLHKTLTETLGGLDLEAMLTQPLFPEPQRGFRDRQRNAADLAGALAGLAPRMAHREAGDQPADIARVIAVVEVEDRLFTVIQGGLLDTLQTEHLGMKVVVFLAIPHAERQMVVTLDVLIRAHRRVSC